MAPVELPGGLTAAYATLRAPERPSLGPVVAEVSRRVRGRELMPWQAYFADVLCELDPDHPGEWWYKKAIVCVPRQAGKSDVIGAVHTHRLLAFADHRAVMTAQTGKDAGKRWRSYVEDIPDIEESGVTVMRGKGAERLTYDKTGSYLEPFPPTDAAIHGDAIDDCSVDEAWAYTIEQGATIQAAVRPAQATRPLSQFLLLSTRGSEAASGGWLDQEIAAGRAAVNDPASRTLYLEFSADPAAADADPYSDETLAFHPAIGHTQSLRRLRDLASGLPLAEWRRAFLNLPTEGDASAVIDVAVWTGLALDEPPARPRPADTVIAYDVARDNTAATIAAAWLDPDGDPVTAVVWSSADVRDLDGYIRRLWADGYRRIVADPTGPTRLIAETLADDGIGRLGAYTDYQDACQELIDRTRTGTVRHVQSAAVVAAIQAARPRITSRGTDFDAAKSDAPIDALRATALAVHEARQLSKPTMQMW